MRSLVRLAVKIVWQRKSRPEPTGPILFGILCNNCHPSPVSSKCCETATRTKQKEKGVGLFVCFVCLFVFSLFFYLFFFFNLPGWIQEVIELLISQPVFFTAGLSLTLPCGRHGSVRQE